MIDHIQFRYDLLNRYNQKIGTVDASDGSVTLNSLAVIKRISSFTIKENEGRDIDYLNDRICPIMLRKENGVWIEYPLGVYLLPSPKKYTKDGVVYRDISGYDVTLNLERDKFLKRTFFKKGMNYVTAITQIVNSANIDNVYITESATTLNRDREFEMGTSKITAINELLNEMNYTSLHTDEYGGFVAKPYILPQDREITKEYRTGVNSVIDKDSATDELDYFDTPNIWKVTASNPESEIFVAEYRNDDPQSKLSTISRGINIVDIREINDIADQATLEAYVRRIATEANNKYQQSTFRTIKDPTHGYSEAIYLEHDKLGIGAKYIETSWTLPLKVGEMMEHTVRRVVTL